MCVCLSTCVSVFISISVSGAWVRVCRFEIVLVYISVC